MEQAIVQFVARHPLATEFPGFTVECRTTFCELAAIQVQGELSSLSWQRLLYELREHLHPELGNRWSASRLGPSGPRLEAVLGRAGMEYVAPVARPPAP